MVLCELGPDSVAVLDPSTLELTAWRPDWTPEADGWSTGGLWALDVSSDGEWVLLAPTIWVSEEFEHGWSGSDAIALVLCRSDGSEARGLLICPHPMGGEQPVFGLVPGETLIYGNCIACRYMPADEYAGHIRRTRGLLPLEPDGGWFDFEEMAFPETGCGGDGIVWFGQLLESPSGALLACADDAGEGAFGGLTVFDQHTLEPVLDFMLAEEDQGYLRSWVDEEHLLVSINGRSGLLSVPNGVLTEIPEGQDWKVYCSLPSEGMLLTRDGGSTAELVRSMDWEALRPTDAETLHLDPAELSELILPLERGTALIGPSWGRGGLRLLDLRGP
ncbi:hypothetical protein JW921_03650 [Candidatus Fermentibacterales bacterium]|nr:hypothetical protein [Candidatus Fermentibacterales bacterium]